MCECITSSGKCLDGEEKDEKHDEKEDKRNDKFKLAKGNEKASSSKAPSGTLYTAVSHNALVSTEEPLNTFYIDSGASDHLIPSRGDLCLWFWDLASGNISQRFRTRGTSATHIL